MTVLGSYSVHLWHVLPRMKSELYEGVQTKYLMQHFHKNKPNPSELKSSIHWTKTTSIKPKQYMKIIEDTSRRIEEKTRNQKRKKEKATYIFAHKKYIHEHDMIKLP